MLFTELQPGSVANWLSVTWYAPDKMESMKATRKVLPISQDV